VTACCDDVPHDQDEPCRFASCDICGGPFAFGPSTSRRCSTCADWFDGEDDE
jgi:hypothetical protein